LLIYLYDILRMHGTMNIKFKMMMINFYKHYALLKRRCANKIR